MKAINALGRSLNVPAPENFVPRGEKRGQAVKIYMCYNAGASEPRVSLPKFGAFGFGEL